MAIGLLERLDRRQQLGKGFRLQVIHRSILCPDFKSLADIGARVVVVAMNLFVGDVGPDVGGVEGRNRQTQQAPPQHVAHVSFDHNIPGCRRRYIVPRAGWLVGGNRRAD